MGQTLETIALIVLSLAGFAVLAVAVFYSAVKKRMVSDTTTPDSSRP